MKRTRQVTGNMGMFYVCYELSKLGWNVLPTSRNTAGVDIIIYNQKGDKKHTIQVKSLSDKAPVPLGSKIDNLIADFLIICVLEKTPKIYYLKTKDVLNRTEIIEQKERAAKSYWAFNSKKKDWQYLDEKHLDKWKIIGEGFFSNN